MSVDIEGSVLRIVLLSLCVFVMGCELSFAERLKSCEQQKDDINYEIDQARRFGDVYKQRGLESALYRVERYCRDDEPTQDTEQISRALKDVHRREAQLDAAMESGSPRLVQRYKRRLEQARETLRRVSEEAM